MSTGSLGCSRLSACSTSSPSMPGLAVSSSTRSRPPGPHQHVGPLGQHLLEAFAHDAVVVPDQHADGLDDHGGFCVHSVTFVLRTAARAGLARPGAVFMGCLLGAAPA